MGKGGPEDWNLTDADEALLAAAESGDLTAARAALDSGAKRECYADVRAATRVPPCLAGLTRVSPTRRGAANRWRSRQAGALRSTWR
jgi:hypothetical protein